MGILFAVCVHSKSPNLASFYLVTQESRPKRKKRRSVSKKDAFSNEASAASLDYADDDSDADSHGSYTASDGLHRSTSSAAAGRSMAGAAFAAISASALPSSFIEPGVAGNGASYLDLSALHSPLHQQPTRPRRAAAELIAAIKVALGTIYPGQKGLEALHKALVRHSVDLLDEIGSLPDFLKLHVTEFRLDPSNNTVCAAEDLTEGDLVEDMLDFLRQYASSVDGPVEVETLLSCFVGLNPIYTAKLRAYKPDARFFETHSTQFELSADKTTVSFKTPAQDRVTWEWYDRKKWHAYDAGPAAQLEEAFRAGQPSVTIQMTSDKHPQGMVYTITLGSEPYSQINQTSGFKRDVRRSVAQGADAAAGGAAEPEWMPSSLPRDPNRSVGACKIWSLSYEDGPLTGAALMENRRYAEAMHHYERLSQRSERGGGGRSIMALPLLSSSGRSGSLPGGTRVEFLYNPDVLQRFLDVTQELSGGSDPIWVFHGTHSSFLDSIAREGFKVGGQDVSVRNGASYGHGIYTARGPDTPMQYGHGRSVILALARPGVEGSQHDPACDSWRPRNDWHIFRRGEQLLPIYILHFA